MHVNFHPHVNLLIRVTQQFFSQSMYIYLVPHVDISILVIQLFRSASSCSNSKDGLFSDKICSSLWLVNQLATAKRVCTAIGRKQCCMVLSFLKTYHDIFWGPSLLRRLLDPIIHTVELPRKGHFWKMAYVP